MDALNVGGIYDMEAGIGIGDTVPDPRDFDLNRGGLIYVVAGSGPWLLTICP